MNSLLETLDNMDVISTTSEYKSDWAEQSIKFDSALAPTGINFTPPPPNDDPMRDVIDFVVGGVVFATKKSIFTHVSPSYFDDLLLEIGEGDRVVIDRDPHYFRYILNYLRNKEVFVERTHKFLTGFREEAQYYGLEKLAEDLECHLEGLTEISFLVPQYTAFSLSERRSKVERYMNGQLFDSSASMVDTIKVGDDELVLMCHPMVTNQIIKDPGEFSFTEITHVEEIDRKSKKSVLHLVAGQKQPETVKSKLVLRAEPEESKEKVEIQEKEAEKEEKYEFTSFFKYTGSLWDIVKRAINDDIIRKTKFRSEFFIPSTIFVPTRKQIEIIKSRKRK
ncbi:hypothetical protein PCE1_000146 [Barthelona sp. PCE]